MPTLGLRVRSALDHGLRVGAGDFTRKIRNFLLGEGHGCWVGRRTDASPISQMKKLRLRPRG